MENMLKKYVSMHNKMMKQKQFNIKIELKRELDNFKKAGNLVFIPCPNGSYVFNTDYFLRQKFDNKGNFSGIELISI